MQEHVYAIDHQGRALLDGVLPLVALLSVALLTHPYAVSAVVALYLVFAAGIASSGAERPGEPQAAWRLYALSMGLLAAAVPFGGVTVVPGLAMFAAAFAVHLRVKAHRGLRRVGLLSAFGRRAHDARVGRTLEAAAVALAAAVITGQPALFAIAGWLVTAAAVAERPGLAGQPPATSTVT